MDVLTPPRSSTADLLLSPLSLRLRQEAACECLLLGYKTKEIVQGPHFPRALNSHLGLLVSFQPS